MKNPNKKNPNKKNQTYYKKIIEKGQMRELNKPQMHKDSIFYNNRPEQNGNLKLVRYGLINGKGSKA